MPRISTKNQVTIPVTALEEAGLHAGDQVVIVGQLRLAPGTKVNVGKAQVPS